MGGVRSKGSAATAPGEAAECAHAEWGRRGLLLSVDRTKPHHPLKYLYDEGLAHPSPPIPSWKSKFPHPTHMHTFVEAYEVRAQ